MSEQRKKDLGHFIDDVFDLNRFVDLSLEGLAYGTMADRVTELMRKSALQGNETPVSNDAAYEERRQRDEKLKQFAEREAAKGNPYLFGLAIIRLWSILEAAVKFILLESLKSTKFHEYGQDLTTLSVPLVEFLQASDEERAELILERLNQRISSALKPGMGRFEAPLAAVGRGGGVADSVRRAILELSEVRNILVHRNGIADRKLLEMCPWLQLETGQPHLPSYQDFHIYQSAVFWYILELERRVPDLAHTADMSKRRDTMRGLEVSIQSRWAERTIVSSA